MNLRVAAVAVYAAALCVTEVLAVGSCGADGPRRTANTNCTSAANCSFRGLCEPGLANGTCLCFDGFATLNDQAPCAHVQRSQTTAFLLTTILGWSGADYFYTGQTDIAAGKVVYYIGGALIMRIIVIAQRRDDELREQLWPRLVLLTWKVGAFAWYAYDVIGFATCHEVDGQGVPLHAW
jgi:hypothetical protein